MKTLNKKAIVDFARFGIVKPGDTFFHESRLELDTEIQRFSSREEKKIVPEGELKSQIYRTLEATIHEIVINKKVDAFAMSGGADSRLIFSILYKNHSQFLKELYVYTRIHPSLGKDRDRDYLLAKKVCMDFGVKLNGEYSKIHPQFFLSPLDSKFNRPLSGIWGTELLGGVLFDEMLFNKEDLFSDASNDSSLKNYLLKSGINKNNYDENQFFIHFHLLLKSKKTAFYRSITWLCPSAFHIVSETPFLDEKLIQLLADTHSSKLLNYKIYSQILLEYCEPFLKTPMNNDIIENQFKLGMRHFGEEPKESAIFFNFNHSSQNEIQPIADFLTKHKDLPYTDYLLSILKYQELFKSEEA